MSHDTLTRPAASPANTPVTAVTTRFIYPFYYQRGALRDAVAKLTADRIGGGPAFWEQPTEPDGQYTDEFLEHVVAYLFPGATHRTDDPAACAYLRVGATARAWFAGVRPLPPAGARGEVVPLGFGVGFPDAAENSDFADGRVEPPPPVELFLTAQGVGVLCVTLAATGEGLTGADAIQFNYRLAQYRHSRSVALGTGVDVEQATAATVADHLAGPRKRFLLQDVLTRLTAPLETLDRRPIQPRELCVYTVVRLPAADLGDPAVRAGLAPLLSALAQVEPGGSAGPAGDGPTVPALLVNRRHWIGVGVLGAAHLVTDQPPEGDRPLAYNDLRPLTALNKYFVSYLLALFQQHTTHRAVAEAVRVYAVEDTTVRLARTRALRQDLLRFGVGGLFTQVSSRHTHHRFYHLCQEALDVRGGWEAVTRAVADLDADLAAVTQKRLAGRMDKSVREITHVQRLVHVLEYVLVAVYLAHFWHMLAHDNHTLAAWAAECGVGHDGLIAGGMCAAALLGLGLVKLFNNLVLPKHTDAE